MEANHTHSIDVERAAIAVVLDGRHLASFDTLMSIVLTPLAFYDRNHQIVLLGCQEVSLISRSPMPVRRCRCWPVSGTSVRLPTMR